MTDTPTNIRHIYTGHTADPGYVHLPPGDCGRPIANRCGFGYPPNCGVHGAPSPMTSPMVTEAGPGVEDPPGSGMYLSATAPANAAVAAAPVVPLPLHPGPTYEPRTIPTSHPDGAASWGQVLTWAVHADHIGTADEAGVLWCSAGEQCQFPRWSRFDPSRPGDVDRPVSELFCWLAEHWGCTRG